MVTVKGKCVTDLELQRTVRFCVTLLMYFSKEVMLVLWYSTSSTTYSVNPQIIVDGHSCASIYSDLLRFQMTPEKCFLLNNSEHIE